MENKELVKLVVKNDVFVDSTFTKDFKNKEGEMVHSRMALIKVYKDDGTFMDAATVWCNCENPRHIEVSIYKGQLNVRLVE